MTIQEAIKSGKPFRRRGMGTQNWAVIDKDGIIVFQNGFRKHYIFPFSSEDIPADDWEVKNED